MDNKNRGTFIEKRNQLIIFADVDKPIQRIEDEVTGTIGFPRDSNEETKFPRESYRTRVRFHRYVDKQENKKNERFFTNRCNLFLQRPTYANRPRQGELVCVS